MLDMKFVRDNPETVKENLRKKFKEDRIPMVDEVIQMYSEMLNAKHRAEELRASRNRVSKEIGGLMAKGLRDEAEEKKKLVTAQAEELKALSEKETTLDEEIRERLMKLPNIVDPSVPVGRDDSENVDGTLRRACRSRFRDPLSRRAYGALPRA